MGKSKTTPMTPDASRRMQSAFDQKIAEQPPPKVVAELQAAKSRVMSAADKSESE
jgi:hypothetical protein